MQACTHASLSYRLDLGFTCPLLRWSPACCTLHNRISQYIEDFRPTMDNRSAEYFAGLLGSTYCRGCHSCRCIGSQAELRVLRINRCSECEANCCPVWQVR